MRGEDEPQSGMFSYISAEQRVPQDHPLRPMRRMTDVALRGQSRRFDAMYAKRGRPSIAPEKLLRALLLQMLYSIRSERMLMEQLDYNLLFRWFVGLNMDDRVWEASTFSQNRERLRGSEVAQAFFDQVRLVARARLTHAYGSAETHAALQMLASLPGSHPVTCGADKGFDNRQFESECGNLNARAHVARKRIGSAIPARRAEQVGYGISQRKRKRIEEVFGWMKTVALLRKTRYRGRERVEWAFTFAAAAYNLVRMRKLLAPPA